MIILSLHMHNYGTGFPFSWGKVLKHDVKNNLIGENTLA